MKIAKLQTIPERSLRDCPYGLFLYYIKGRKKPHLGFKSALTDPINGSVVAFNVKFGKPVDFGATPEERDAYMVYPLLFNDAKMSGMNQDLKKYLPSKKGSASTIPPDSEDDD